MSINVNIKRKFKINGKEYTSIEEMPDDVRDAFKKAMALGTHLPNSLSFEAKITFNGTEYKGIDAMPHDVRQLYERTMKTVEDGTSVPVSGIGEIGGTPKGSDAARGAFPGTIHTPPKIESSFSPRVLIAGILVSAMLILIYFLFQGR